LIAEEDEYDEEIKYNTDTPEHLRSRRMGNGIGQDNSKPGRTSLMSEDVIPSPDVGINSLLIGNKQKSVGVITPVSNKDLSNPE
jgi:hypothetical protein